MTSSPFLNRLLFGHGKSDVSPEYIETLKPFMYTKDHAKIEPEIHAKIEPEIHKKMEVVKTRFTPREQHTLFWSIFVAVYEMPEYLEASRKSGNREIAEKLRIVDSLKPFPKKLKETNSKLTLEQTQALYGTMITSKEDRLDFCVAYAASYRRTIWILYPKTYRVYSPNGEIDYADPIIIWANPGPKHSVVYSLDQSEHVDIRELVSSRETELKAQTHYKLDQLHDLANKMGVEDEKGWKKVDWYNAVKVAIYRDMNFCKEN